jgi:hypothetical protein
LNAARKGALLDNRSCLAADLAALNAQVRTTFTLAKHLFLAESVSSMDPEDLSIYSDFFELKPVQICCSSISPCRRNRLYWVNWRLLEEPNAILQSGALTNHVTFELIPFEWKDFLNPGSIKVDPSSPCPTFTRAIPKQEPGFKPAGIDKCDEETLQRWADDHYKFPPYTYQLKHCIRDPGGQMRQPTAEEREKMLGYPAGFTSPCLPKNLRRASNAQWEVTRLSLLGNAWSLPVILWLIAQGLHSAFPHHFACIPIDEVVRLVRDQFTPSKEPSPLHISSLTLVKRLLLSCNSKGVDVKLGSSDNTDPNVWPRRPVEARWWKWKVVGSWKFQHLHGPEHINVLEMRAFLASIRWRLRNVHNLNSRFLHLLDSQVCLGILSKGRTSSRKLRAVVEKVAALLLAGHLVAFSAWVPSN